MHLVREFRLKYGWDQMELARRAKVSMKLITNIELNQDHDCQRRTMIKISDAFNIPPSVLFFPMEETQKRKMMAALVAVCVGHMPENQVYDILQELNHTSPHQPDGLDADPVDEAMSQENQPSVVILT
jgi:transcriptional regulator with XRE-family HTH domain